MSIRPLRKRVLKIREDGAQIAEKVGTSDLKDEVALDKYYRYEQAVASKEWIIEHNLGKNPSVITVDTAGTEIKGEIHYINESKVKILFTYETSGYAYLN